MPKSYMGGAIKDFTEQVLLTVNAKTIDALNNTANLLRDTMKSPGYCPRKTGDLAKSIKVKRYDKQLMARIFIGNKKAFYAHMVIGGTKRPDFERYTKVYGKWVKQKVRGFITRPNNFPLRALNDKRNEIKELWGETNVKVNLGGSE